MRVVKAVLFSLRCQKRPTEDIPRICITLSLTHTRVHTHSRTHTHTKHVHTHIHARAKTDTPSFPWTLYNACLRRPHHISAQLRGCPQRPTNVQTGPHLRSKPVTCRSIHGAGRSEWVGGANRAGREGVAPLRLGQGAAMATGNAALLEKASPGEESFRTLQQGSKRGLFGGWRPWGRRRRDGEEEATFSSSLTVVISMLGCAVGTGNIWRFPRIVANHATEGGMRERERVSGLWTCVKNICTECVFVHL